MRKWNIPTIQSVLSEDFCCDFKWLWNIPRASHQNGVLETLIKSVRHSLDAICKIQAFTEEQWRTFLSETTYIINGRPLYPSSNDMWEGYPSHQTIFLWVIIFLYLNLNLKNEECCGSCHNMADKFNRRKGSCKL